MTHYERLGVSAEATTTEIRAAYRRLARRFHPDALGGNDSVEMSAINEAWRVLGDAGRRAVYDGGLRRAAAPPRPVNDPGERYSVPADALVDDGRPARFPIWAVVALVVLGAIFVFTAGALQNDAADPPTDGLLRNGECVDVNETLAAVEVPCSGPHQYVVEQFVTPDTSCPIETREFRDSQGMGKVCVVAP